MPEVSTLFWDNGGVILTNGWDRTSRRAAVDKFKLDWADFEDRHELMLNDFETARATLDEYLRRVVFYRDRPFTLDDFKKFMFEQSQPFPESLDFIKKLAQTHRYPMCSLNNESLELNEYRIRTFKLRDYFESFFSSCYLGLRKPNIEIYKLALKITQREPQECVMIDDRGLNLETAKEIGIHTIQFKNVSQLRADLAQLDIVVASVHSRFDQPMDVMTARLLRAHQRKALKNDLWLYVQDLHKVTEMYREEFTVLVNGYLDQVSRRVLRSLPATHKLAYYLVRIQAMSQLAELAAWMMDQPVRQVPIIRQHGRLLADLPFRKESPVPVPARVFRPHWRDLDPYMRVDDIGWADGALVVTGSASRKQYDLALPRPTRPRNWCN